MRRARRAPFFCVRRLRRWFRSAPAFWLGLIDQTLIWPVLSATATEWALLRVPSFTRAFFR